MRAPIIIAALAVTACAPSPRAAREAREARYGGDRGSLIDAVVRSVPAEHKIYMIDREHGTITTFGRERADGNSAVRQGARSRTSTGRVLNGRLVIRILGSEAPFQVVVDPLVTETRIGYATQTLEPGDPTYPGWAIAQAESVQLAIRRRLAKWVFVPPSPN